MSADFQVVALLADGGVLEGDERIGIEHAGVLGLANRDRHIRAAPLDGRLQVGVGHLFEGQRVVGEGEAHEIHLEPLGGLVHDVGRDVEGYGGGRPGLVRQGPRVDQDGADQEKGEEREDSCDHDEIPVTRLRPNPSTTASAMASDAVNPGTRCRTG